MVFCMYYSLASKSLHLSDLYNSDLYSEIE